MYDGRKQQYIPTKITLQEIYYDNLSMSICNYADYGLEARMLDDFQSNMSMNSKVSQLTEIPLLNLPIRIVSCNSKLLQI